MVLNIQEIQKIIPHRFPFLMIDRVIELVPNEKLVAIKNVSVNEAHFLGHFPEEKVMPGVLMIEAMAQAGCVYFYYSKNCQDKSLIYYLAKATAKFHKPVVPGDQLNLMVKMIKAASIGGICETEATVGNEVVAKGDMSFACK